MPGFVRSIKFTIPGVGGAPGVEVYVEESGTGALLFNVSVLDTASLTADLRGLFFRLADATKLVGLKATSTDGTVTDFQAIDNKVIDLGDGANMNGAVTKTNAFDVGVEFGTQGIGKDDIQDSAFTLSNTANNLTLDDIAQTLFGARLTSVGSPTGSRSDSAKLTATAPAAPDARNDVYSIFEDNASGLNDPRSSALGVKFEILSNDTDADGNKLTITKLLGTTEGTLTVTTANGGTVTIIDGDDADSLIGDAIRYTPQTDFAGTDSFTYLISDGAGGTDFATVTFNIAAVADIPTLAYSLAATSIVNQVKLTVTATQTDDDLSEFIDNFILGSAPVTVTPNDVLDPATQPLSLTREFLLTLPNAASAFTLDVTATSKEVSNGDTETNSVGVNFFSIFEDGASSLNDARSASSGVLLQLSGGPIASIGGVAHGSITFADGDDADTLLNDAVLYTPTTDYAGWDSFTYVTASGAVGQASITVNAVADVPDLTYQILAGSAVNEVIVRVTATTTDNDGSEFIDKLAFSGAPGTVQVVASNLDPATQTGSLTRDFKLILPLDKDTNFDFVVTATSQELSNGDTQTGSTTVNIDYQYNKNDFDTTFYATDQSIWSSGDQFTFVDNRFLGIDESWDERVGGFAFAESNGRFKAGFQSKLTFEGGEIDGQVPYDLFVDTNYNKTTDVLVIGSGASLLSGGGFTTEGPEGSYKLDFLFDFFLHAAAGLDFGDLGTWDLISVDLGPWNINQNILNLNSDDLTFTVGLPAGFSLTFAWPNVDTTSNATNVYTSSGASNQFFRLDLDIDDLVTAALGLPINPFAPGFDIGVASGRLDLIDADIGLGLNFLQDFAMAVNSLSATIFYENGASSAFTFGSDITLANASTYDADNDGVVEFELVVDPQATLTNSTDLGFNFNWNFDLLRLSGEYDVVFDSGSFDTGAAVDLGGTIPIASVPVFDSTFALDFASENFLFGA